MTQHIIASELRRLTPFIERLSGSDIRGGFRDAFENAAGRYALGKINDQEFRAVVQELIRDAAGTAAQQDRAADGIAQYREPWATMPQDEYRMPWRSRVLAGLSLTLLAVLMALLGWTLRTPSAAPESTPHSPAGVSVDADLITTGGYWSWSVTETCGMRPEAECEQTLQEVNASARQYGLKVFEDGSIAPLGY